MILTDHSSFDFQVRSELTHGSHHTRPNNCHQQAIPSAVECGYTHVFCYPELRVPVASIQYLWHHRGAWPLSNHTKHMFIISHHGHTQHHMVMVTPASYHGHMTLYGELTISVSSVSCLFRLGWCQPGLYSGCNLQSCITIPYPTHDVFSPFLDYFPNGHDDLAPMQTKTMMFCSKTKCVSMLVEKMLATVCPQKS